ncbi:DUF3159 domain-containing protein [Wenjunlia tyrosinilytica]|uniref:Membrane protein n=1 Tax=Wenjunlia tyrosinilytica TaxID=1544741 RepID=A0A917ZSF1_9ACTN|nr:DUF3159 domain-containing protein [Wenjunlia tyrosinilytica]GGO91205.1 membrane protein [Wenjunlia tyrosinilytica]
MADAPEDTTAMDHHVDEALGRPLDGMVRRTADEAAQPTEEERRAAHEEANREAAATLIKAFGGVRGMVDTTLPGLVFVVVFTITHKVAPAAWSAFGLTAAFALVRLLRRETLQHALSGVFGVAIGAFIATKSGKAENFYLPGLIYSVGYVIAFIVSAVVRWPLIGVLLGPILGENLTWKRNNPGRYKAYLKATWVWAGIMAIKPLILFPVYFTHDVTLLGWLKVALGIPPFLLAVYLTWLILAKAPPPVKVVLDDEDGRRDTAGKNL